MKQKRRERTNIESQLYDSSCFISALSPKQKFGKSFLKTVFGMPNMIQTTSLVSDLLAVLLQVDVVIFIPDVADRPDVHPPSVGIYFKV